MVTTLERKTGGPYTKKEQEQRRDQVYALHFEKGYAAVKIAEMINVNRNTVNEDIKYWYAQISEDFEKSSLPGLWALKQYSRLENQRGRLIDELEKQERLRDKMILEKMILDVDSKISELAIKIGPVKKNEEIPEEQIRDIVRKIIFNGLLFLNLDKEKIILEIISVTKYNKDKAEKIFTSMEDLGLGLNRNTDDVIRKRYDLLSFAELRSFLTNDELDEVYDHVRKSDGLLKLMHKVEDYEIIYGEDRTKWPKEALDEIEEFASRN